MCVSSHEHVTCMYIYTHVTIPKNGRWEKLSKSHSPCWTSARLTSPYKFVHATVLLLLRFGGFYQKQTKVQPATPWEMQAIVLAKGISRFETLQDSSFVPRLTQMWTDFNGSFKSCNKVQASSQTNSDHEKAWSKSLFSHMYSANSFFNFYIARMEYIRMLRNNLGKPTMRANRKLCKQCHLQAALGTQADSIHIHDSPLCYRNCTWHVLHWQDLCRVVGCIMLFSCYTMHFSTNMKTVWK